MSLQGQFENLLEHYAMKSITEKVDISLHCQANRVGLAQALAKFVKESLPEEKEHNWRNGAELYGEVVGYNAYRTELMRKWNI